MSAPRKVFDTFAEFKEVCIENGIYTIKVYKIRYKYHPKFPFPYKLRYLSYFEEVREFLGIKNMKPDSFHVKFKYLSCESVLRLCDELDIQTIRDYDLFYKEMQKKKIIPKNPIEYYAKDGFYFKVAFKDKSVGLSFSKKREKILQWQNNHQYKTWFRAKQFARRIKTKPNFQNLVDYLNRKDNINALLPNNPSDIINFPGWNEYFEAFRLS